MVVHKCTVLRNILRTHAVGLRRRAAAVERKRPQWSGSGRSGAEAAAVEGKVAAQRRMSAQAASRDLSSCKLGYLR